MLLDSIKKAPKKISDFGLRHWKAVSALLIAAGVLASVTGAVILAPAVIPFLASVVIFGAAPLAFLMGMPVAAAAVSIGVVVAIGVLAGFAAFNLATAISNWLDKKITPKREIIIEKEEVEVEVEVTEESNCRRALNKLPCFGKKASTEVNEEVKTKEKEKEQDQGVYHSAVFAKPTIVKSFDEQPEVMQQRMSMGG